MTVDGGYGTWPRVLWRSLTAFQRDNCVDMAAALTYWALLSVFPAAVVVVALAGLVATGQSALDTMVGIVEDLAPAGVATVLEERLGGVAGERRAAGYLLSVGVLGALWTASAYLRSFTRAANSIYEVREARPFYRLLPLQLGLTVVGLALVAVVVVGLVVSGPVAEAVGGAVGFPQTAVAVWEVAKWPVLVLIAVTLLSLLFWVAPSVERPRLRWLGVGGAATLLGWAVASVGFGFYVANFGSYDATYGTLGAVIVFLVWVFLANCAILLGVEINAEVQRRRRPPATDGASPDAPTSPAAPPAPRAPAAAPVRTLRE